VLTTGTFLGGKIHIGLEIIADGRAGDPASIAWLTGYANYRSASTA